MLALTIVKAVLAVVLSIIPILGSALASVTSFGFDLLLRILLWMTILLWLWLMFMAWRRPNYRLPFFGVLRPDFLSK
jgi:uncharacterized membrane protein